MAGKGDTRRACSEHGNNNWYDNVNWGTSEDIVKSITMCPHCGYYCSGKTVYCTKETDGED